MKKAFAVFVIILLVALSTTVVIVHNGLPAWQTKKFYVGVTNCGDSVEDAIQLINKVKDYTNLFVVQSALVSYNLTEIEQICDYAVNSGLNIIVYFGTYGALQDSVTTFLNTAKTRWGSHFLGLYYGDELGGKMLDYTGQLYNVSSFGNIFKDHLGYAVEKSNETIKSINRYDFSGEIRLDDYDVVDNKLTSITYFTNGTIRLFYSYEIDYTKNEVLMYYTNGTVTRTTDWNNIQVVTDRGNITQFKPYEEVLDTPPSYDLIGTAYVENNKQTIDWVHNQTDVDIFTADYALHWWDYQVGYDVVFAELGWNNTVAQEIGLVRGAAKLQDKSWGTIITWTYNNPPYLTTGEEMYNQMCTSHECGADYVIIFNYGEEMNSAYGTLQQEHFEALERFWNDVVQDPFAVERGSTESEAVLVLPKNYGWGMRTPDDKIWGILDADETSVQIWQISRNLLEQYGTKLDIVYEDSEYAVEGKYPNVFYWNQTIG